MPTERPKVGELRAQVDRDVEHFAGDDAHELALRVLDLVVEAAQHAAPRARVVVLHERRVEPGRRERARVPALEEEAALVAEDARLDRPARPGARSA